MSAKKDDFPVHELAGGWITERKGTPVPGFLKLAYVFFCLFGLGYLFLWFQGETGHATRGALVETFNLTSPPPSLIWAGVLAAVLLVYVIGLLRYAFTAKEEESQQ
jgi:hypothetical protein